VVIIWAMTTRAWRDARPPERAASLETDRTLSAALLVITFLQLMFGAVYRHFLQLGAASDEAGAQEAATLFPWPAHVHLTLAAIVIVLSILVGLRVWAKYGDVPALTRSGLSLLHTLGLQIVLGVVALVAVLSSHGSAFEIIFATAHQANGALFFACAVLTAVWVRRLASLNRNGPMRYASSSAP